MAPWALQFCTFCRTKVLHFWYKINGPVISLCWKRWTDPWYISIPYSLGSSLEPSPITMDILPIYFVGIFKAQNQNPPGARPRCPALDRSVHDSIPDSRRGCWDVGYTSMKFNNFASEKLQKPTRWGLSSNHPFSGCICFGKANFNQEVYESWLNFENSWIFYRYILLIYHIQVYTGIKYAIIYI